MLPVLLLSWTACAADSAAVATPPAREKLDRAVVVVGLETGKNYVSWRLLPGDPADGAFNVYRQTGADVVRLNTQPLTKTTDFVDTSAPSGLASYFVRGVAAGQEGPASAAVKPTAPGQPYLSIPIQGNATIQKIGIADLDGDGQLDFVVKTPQDNIDPYEKYWKPSPDTYKLNAYTHDGKFLWQYDLGWAIERGIWYSPYLVWDLDGDGRAEVIAKTGEGDPRDADGRVKTGPEYVTVLNGQTGKPVAQAPWPAREAFDGSYNYASRNQLGVAYLDGKHPSLIVARGTYTRMLAEAYEYREGKLHKQWQWSNADLGKEFRGQGAHWMQCLDLDGDGRDEVILGSVVLDDDGRVLWNTGMGHPDSLYVGDLDPTRPGMEIYYNYESKQSKNGMCMADAKTGKILWGLDQPTHHVHSFGMCSDIDPAYPGCECYGADTDAKKAFAFGVLHSAQGKEICRENLGGFGWRTAYWDADLQREILADKRNITKFRGPVVGKVEGAFVATVDLLGDWREEIITTLPGEMRIYTTTIPAADRRTCLLADPLYRNDVIHATMGYYQCPMTSYDLPKAAGK
jgi:rhamnogalacturonan endolyase